MAEQAGTSSEIVQPKIWWVVRGHDKSGPYARGELKLMASGGELLPSDHLWKEGLEKPVPLVSVLGMPAAGGKATPAGPTRQEVDNPYRPSPGVLAESPREPAPPRSGRSTWLFTARIMGGFAIIGAAISVLIMVCALLPDPKPWFVSGRLLADTVRVAALGYVAYKSCMKKVNA